MKMSDVFALPMTQGITCVMSKDHRHEIVFDESDSNVSDQIEHVAHAINSHDRMAEEIAKLRHELDNLIYMAENNTGNEPSPSCLHLAIDEAKHLLKSQSTEKQNQEGDL